METLKSILKIIINWIKGTGWDGFLTLALAAFFFVAGRNVLMAFFLGFFVCTNWKIITKFIIEKWNVWKENRKKKK